MGRRVERYRRVPLDPRGQYTIGCIILQEPFFFAEADWLPAPADFQQADRPRQDREPPGRELWRETTR